MLFNIQDSFLVSSFSDPFIKPVTLANFCTALILAFRLKMLKSKYTICQAFRKPQALTSS